MKSPVNLLIKQPKYTTMKKLSILILFLTNYIYSQTTIKTYYDPIFKTKLKEVYQVKPNTPTLNGNYKLYDEYGYILIDRNYTNNKQNGKSTTYYGVDEASIYENVKCLGKISGVFNYKNGIPEGLQTSYDYTKEGIRYLIKTETYANGIMNKHVKFFSNGKEEKVIQFGKCYEYYENGNKLAEYTTDKDGQLQGKYISWYQSGKIIMSGEFINDDKSGLWTEYNEDGSIKIIEEYDLGTKIPSLEEKILEEKRKKEEEDNVREEERLKSEKQQEWAKKWAKEKELVNLKKIESEKTSELSKIKRDYEMESQLVITHYKYWDEDSYKYQKKNLYKSYEIVTKYISENIESSNNDIYKKIELVKLGLKLSAKMNNIIDEDTRLLEKELKKTEDVGQIIELFSLK
jgi:antitoxin component YwqK of YwqJK toxin-antitoxin module